MLKYIIILLFLHFSKVINCENNSTSFFNRFKRSYTCGLSKKSEGLIIGGRYFQKDDYPWMTSLMYDTGDDIEYFCGGVLISNKRILSAAHCIYPKNGRRKRTRDVITLLGAYDLKKSFEPDRISKNPQFIYIHPDWNPKILSYDGDIAVLILDEEVSFSKSIQPICLWEYSGEPPENSGTIIGYGKSEDRTKTHETIPKELNVPIISSNEQCLLNEPKFASIASRRTFCVGAGSGSGPCFGDSGHGLFVQYNGIYYLRGLISSSFIDRNENSCDVTKYALCTNVLKYREWIQNPSEDYDHPQPIQPTEATPPHHYSPQPQQTSNFPTLQYKFQYDDRFCGIMSQSSGLVSGGTYSSRHQFPWFAIVRKRGFIEDKYGSLISSRHVIVRPFSLFHSRDSNNNVIYVKPEDVTVFLGMTKYDGPKEPGSLETGVSSIVHHPLTRKDTKADIDVNAVSILTLSNFVSFNEFIRPVCLWPFGDNENDIIGRDAYVVGYADDKVRLRKHVRATIKPCSHIYTRQYEHKNEAKIFCAQGNGYEGPCLEDEPLYMKIGSIWYLKGLKTLFFSSAGTCDLNYPILYEDLFPLVPWIQDQIKTL